MNPDKGDGSKRLSVERIYQKKTQLEHILLRPDTYIGSVEEVTQPMWVYDELQDAIVERQIKFVPGLYKIFDEILGTRTNVAHWSQWALLAGSIGSHLSDTARWSQAISSPYSPSVHYACSVLFTHAVNAADNKQRDPRMNALKVVIDQ